MSSTTEIRNPETIRAIQTSLNKHLAAGTLTVQQLIDAINSIDATGYEIIPGSIGLKWLSNLLDQAERARKARPENAHGNADVIAAERLRACIPMEDVYLVCVGNPHIAVMLCDSKLIGLIRQPADRAAFMHAILEQHWPYNSAWVRVCLEAGIAQSEIAKAILSLLRRDPTSNQAGRSFLLHDFLDDGAGQARVVDYESDKPIWQLRESNTLWSVLTDDQLIEAMRICIGKTPWSLFGPRSINSALTLAEKLDIRLTTEQLQTLLAEAADKLTSLAGVSIEAFSRLALQRQRQLIEEIPDCSLELLVHTAAQVPDHFTFFRDQAGKICEDASTALSKQFCKLQPQLAALRMQSDTLRRFADHVDRTLVNQLELQGYIVDTLVKQPYRDGWQLCVQHDGHAYVEQRGWSSVSGDRYFPELGDRVVFKPSNGRRLTPRVTAVPFSLVSRPAKSTRV